MVERADFSRHHPHTEDVKIQKEQKKGEIMGYSRMICAGNRVMVLFEGYTQEELAPILQTLNKLTLNVGNVPHLIPPESKPKSGDEAMNEVLKQAERPAGRQEKVAEQRRQSLAAGIQPPKFMENAMKQTEGKVVPKESPEPAKPEKAPEPTAPNAKSQAKPAVKRPAPASKPKEMMPQPEKEPVKPVNVPEKPVQEIAKQAVSPERATQEKPVTKPIKEQVPETQGSNAPDVMTMSKAELRNFFTAVDRMAFQKVLQSRGEFANRGIFLARASEQQMREYAKLVLNA